jgi:hypothetical protein
MQRCHRVVPWLVVGLGLAVTACAGDATGNIGPGTNPPATTDPAREAAWTVEPVSFPLATDRMDAFAEVRAGTDLVAVGIGPDHTTDLSLSQAWVWRSTDGLHWQRSPLPLTDGDEFLQPTWLPTAAVLDGTIYVVGNGYRMIDPHRPDGSGIRPESDASVGIVLWSADGGATWQHTSTPAAARFDSVGLAGGTIWLGGATEHTTNIDMQAAVWSMTADGTITSRGVIGPAKGFNDVVAIEARAGTAVATVAGNSYARTKYHLVGDTWTPTGDPVVPDEVAPPVPLGLNGQLQYPTATLTLGEQSFVWGANYERDDVRYCFQDGATCKAPGTAMAFRTGDGPWTQMVLPEGFLIGYQIPPEVDGTRIVLYEIDQHGAPTRRAVLDLSTGAPPVVHMPEPPPLPAPQFDGTLAVEQPEAVEVSFGCGSERLTVDGVELAPADWPATMPAGVQVRTIDYIADGPSMAVYGLLVRHGDGSVEFTATDGGHIADYAPAEPPQFVCG